jgi:hypothetical protein
LQSIFFCTLTVNKKTLGLPVKKISQNESKNKLQSAQGVTFFIKNNRGTLNLFKKR